MPASRALIAAGVLLVLFAGVLERGPAPGRASSASGEITVAVSWLRPFDPLKGFHVGAFGVIERLVRIGPSGAPEPELVSRWERVDASTWRFHLRRDVLFHDGTPLTAETVKFALERWLHSPVGWAVKPPIISVRAEDGHTVVVRTDRPTELLPNYLAQCPILSPTSLDPHGRFIRPIGTGPFRFEGGRERIEMVLGRYEGYRNGPPALARIRVREVRDPQTRILMLESGGADVITEVSPQAVPRLRALAGIEVLLNPTPFTHQLVFNLRKPPLEDRRVRQSIDLAVDRTAIVQHVLEGIGTVATGPFPRSFPGAAGDVHGQPRDLAKAAALLAAAGWTPRSADGLLQKGGQPLRLSLLTNTYRAELPLMVEVIQSDLRRVGIDARVEVLEWGALDERMSKGRYDLVLSARAVGLLGDPLGYLMADIHSRGPYNRAGYASARVDGLLEKAQRVAERPERFALYAEVQRILQEDLPVAYLAHDVLSAAVRSHVRGFAFASPLEARYTVEKVSVGGR